MHRLWQATMGAFVAAALLAGGVGPALADQSANGYWICVKGAISMLAAQYHITPAAVVKAFPGAFHDESDVIRLFAGYCQAGATAQGIAVVIWGGLMDNIAPPMTWPGGLP